VWGIEFIEDSAEADKNLQNTWRCARLVSKKCDFVIEHNKVWNVCVDPRWENTWLFHALLYVCSHYYSLFVLVLLFSLFSSPLLLEELFNFVQLVASILFLFLNLSHLILMFLSSFCITNLLQLIHRKQLCGTTQPLK